MLAQPAALSDDYRAVAERSQNVDAFTLNARAVGLDNKVRTGLQNFSRAAQNVGLRTLDIDLQQVRARNALTRDNGIERVGIDSGVGLEAQIDLADLDKGSDPRIEPQITAHSIDSDRIELEARDRLVR